VRVLVIGCGLAGVTCAWFLRQHGAEVTVIDRGAAAASETSHANGSMMTPSLADPWNAPGVLGALLRAIGRDDAAMVLRLRALPSLLRWGAGFLRHATAARFRAAFFDNAGLARYSQQVMQRLLQAVPLDFEYAPDGTIKVFRDAAAFTAAQDTAAWLQASLAIPSRRLDRAALLELEPALAASIDGFVGGLHFVEDEVGNAQQFCEALRREAAAAGVDFRFGETLQTVARPAGRIAAVITDKGRHEADAFVLAAGSYSWPLGRHFGITVPVRPAKGYSLTVPLAAGEPVPRRAVVDEALHAAVVPLGGTRLRVAGTAEFAGFATQPSPGRVDNLRGLLRQVYPDVATDGKDIQPWCGLRPMTMDGRPLVGRTAVANLFLNTGHGALGWTHACGSGKALADLICGVAPETDLEPFRPERF
jgi:D-amino-acid dehydrogenase